MECADQGSQGNRRQASETRKFGQSELSGEAQWVFGDLCGGICSTRDHGRIDGVIGVDLVLVAAYAVDLWEGLAEVEDVGVDYGKWNISTIEMDQT